MIDTKKSLDLSMILGKMINNLKPELK